MVHLHRETLPQTLAVKLIYIIKLRNYTILTHTIVVCNTASTTALGFYFDGINCTNIENFIVYIIHLSFAKN